MAHLNKDQLHDAIVARGVDPGPPSALNKEALLAIYESMDDESGSTPQGDMMIFSSDDEDFGSPGKKGKGKGKGASSSSRQAKGVSI